MGSATQAIELSRSALACIAVEPMFGQQGVDRRTILGATSAMIRFWFGVRRKRPLCTFAIALRPLMIERAREVGYAAVLNEQPEIE